jgi:peroxiredoxin
MTMKHLALASFFALGAAAVTATAPVPRKAPEFTIVESSGKQTLLSSYKGKVIVLEFISTSCPHCQHNSVMLTKLHKELGPRGFQPLGVAFNSADNASTVANFVKQFGVDFPVGYATPDTVLSYLGFSVMDRYVYPEIVVIDRKGIIRAQSPPEGDPALQDENHLRMMIDGMLKEGATTTTTKKASAPAKKAS